MIYPQQQIQLKDGRPAILRSPQAADAEAMLTYILAMCAQTEFVGRYPEEVKETKEDVVSSLARDGESKSSVQISAFVDGELAGNASIAPVSGRMKLRHRADFGIAVLKPYWGLGLGNALTLACLEMAKIMGFHQVELSLLETNEKGLNLYRKAGFTVWGKLPGGFRLKNGSYENELCMVKYL